ncbi:MAG: DUF2793 domain-containing protein [Rhodoblastus sp.]
MSNSTRLALPFIDAAQSQKHVTHNEALTALDALVHLAVKARGVVAPPATPAEGDLYLVGSAATGAFAGQAGRVAAFDNGGWAFFSARAGWRAYVETEALFLIFDGADWGDAGLCLQSLQNLSRLGVGAVADAANPVAVKINNALFTAQATGEGGTGDLRMTLNKSASAATVSQIYQTNYSGRAETGLTGDDRFRIKVSADGATWREALNVEPATGLVLLPHTAGQANGLATLDAAGKVPAAQLPAGGGDGGGAERAGFRNRLRNAGFTINQRNLAGLVTLGPGAYGHDGAKAGANGCTYSFAQTGLDVTLTITAGSLILPIEDRLIEGGVYRLSHAGTAQARVWQGTGVTASGAYAPAPFTTANLNANMQTNVEFSTGAVLRPQLEPGDAETAFDRRPHMLELMLCQHYYYRRVAAGGHDVIGMVSAYSAAVTWGKLFDLPVELRAGGALVGVSNPAHLSVWSATGSSPIAATGVSNLRASKRSVSVFGGITVGGAPGFAPGQALFLTFGSAAGWIDVSAEI